MAKEEEGLDGMTAKLKASRIVTDGIVRDDLRIFLPDLSSEALKLTNVPVSQFRSTEPAVVLRPERRGVHLPLGNAKKKSLRRLFRLYRTPAPKPDRTSLPLSL